MKNIWRECCERGGSRSSGPRGAGGSDKSVDRPRDQVLCHVSPNASALGFSAPKNLVAGTGASLEHCQSTRGTWAARWADRGLLSISNPLESNFDRVSHTQTPKTTVDPPSFAPASLASALRSSLVSALPFARPNIYNAAEPVYLPPVTRCFFQSRKLIAIRHSGSYATVAATAIVVGLVFVR